MATTTNYGWTTPDDTSLVKDGASAIRTLGSAIDTSLNTALGTKKAGLVLLNTTTFSGVGSFSLAADTFTSTYDNYKLLFTLSAVSTDQTVSLRMRKAGTDATGANYSYSWYGYRTNNTSDQTGTTGQTSQSLGSTDNVLTGDYYGWQVEIYKPKITGYTATYFTSQATDGSSNHVARFGGGVHLVSDSYDAATILVNTGTFSGTYSVYGYNK